MANAKKSHKSKRKRGKKFRAFVEQVKEDMDGTEDQQNPFESHFRNVSHKKAADARKTLIKEYKNRGKVGGILDRRFNGEQESSATVRYAIERKRSKKASKFDIDSDSENDLKNIRLTHNGEEIDDINEFRHKTNPEDLNDEFNDKFIDDGIVEKLHFGGKDIEEKDEGDDFFKVKKTKQEVFQEIIAKSKMFKAARAELKDQNRELTEQVDDELKDIMPLLITNKRVEQEPEKAITQGINVSLLEVAKRKNDKEIEKKNANRRRDQKLVKKAAPSVEANYNELAVEMRHDCRVRPSQINKSEQEKALDRKAELTKLDKDNKNKRVKFAEEDENESDDGSVPQLVNSTEYVDTDKLQNEIAEVVHANEDESDDEPDEFEAIEDSDSG